MKLFRITIIDSNPQNIRQIQHFLEINPDYELQSFDNGKQYTQQPNYQSDLIIFNSSLKNPSVTEFNKILKAQNPQIPLIVISSENHIQEAVSLLKAGIYDYIVRDHELRERLWNSVRHAKEHCQLQKENELLKKEIGSRYQLQTELIGESEVMQQLFRLITKAAQSSIAVSISGETGTGKELVAKAIHYNSARKDETFMAINVSAIPKELIESELFGYEKGSFTGASTSRMGKIEAASKGTLFLDEIAEMDLNLQTKLLRVLQEMELTRVGANEPRKIDVRIITATHKNITEEVKKGNFRKDLYYRLMGIPILISPLRQRKNDILIIASYFLKNYCQQNRKSFLHFSPDAKNKLLQYQWPGNVRELKAVVELAAVMAEKELITASDISFTELNEEIDLIERETSLDEYIRRILMHFWIKYDKNALLIADKLAIGKSTVYRMVKRYKL